MLFNRIENVFHIIGDKVLIISSKLNNNSIDIKDTTREVVIKSDITMPVFTIETQQTLSEKTKYIICVLASEKYGIVLPLRYTKDALIKAYLIEQAEHI